MTSSRLSTWLLLVVVLFFNSVGGCRKEAPVPEGERGTTGGDFSVGFVYVGPIGDGGWTWAHDEGRLFLEKNLGVKTLFLENIAEGAEAEQAIRGLARKGVDLIITTSFGFMDATEAIAFEFPKSHFVHVSGFKKNNTNFANLMGAMESMRYLAGMIAGARAVADSSTLVGAVEPFPIPEVIRLLNAFALGMRVTCPDCTVQVRWTNSWFDPVREKEAAESLLKAGADVVITGADTPGPVVAAAQAGKWGIGYDSRNACNAAAEACLTTTYWNWGPIYARIVEEIRNGSWKPGDIYLDADSGIVGIRGFEEGEEPAPGVPADVVEPVRALLARMKKGEFNRFDIFSGPIRDNRGNLVVPKGKKLTQEDLEGLKGVPGRPDCTICMNWLAEGVDGIIPAH